MKNFFAIKSIALFTILTLFFSCAEPTTIGSELQELVDVETTDTLSLIMTTIREDSLEIFTPNVNTAFSTFLCGNYNDDILGRTSASIFTQLRVGPAPDTFFNSQDINTMTVLDSLILHLPYDHRAFYGDPEEEYTFEVYQMTEDMNIGDTYYSNTTFTYDPTVIGQVTFKRPSSDTDTTIVDLPASNTSVSVRSHLRIPMDLAFGQQFLDLPVGDSTLNETEDLLRFIKGLHIKSVNEDAGMIGLNLNQLATSSDSANTRSVGAELTFYYHYTTKAIDGSTDTIVYNEHSLFTSSSSDQYIAKTTNATAQFSPEVEAAFDQPVTGDDVLYTQALIGPTIKFEIPYIEEFKDQIINKAELIVTVASPDDENRDSPLQMVVATRASDGTYEVIDDVLFAINRGTFEIFGGRAEENGSIRQYSFNLSAEFQKLIDVKNEPLFLQIFLKEEQVSRMTIYGPDHSLYPAKLDLIYTKLPE